MPTIQEKLDSLQPYVIGIRYNKGMVLVDVVFDDEWIIIDDSLIKKIKGDETLNYYMIYSEDKSIGIDEMLNYVERVIKINKERETKHLLLREKVNELKELFKRSTLEKLKHLKFTFSNDLESSIDDFDVIEIEEEIKSPDDYKSLENNNQVNNDSSINLTDEEKEILEEEERGRRNLELLKNKKNNTKESKISKIELPPRNLNNETTKKLCDCLSDEFCDKCMDSKSL